MKHLQLPHFSISQYGVLLWRLLLAFAMLTLARVIFSLAQCRLAPS